MADVNTQFAYKHKQSTDGDIVHMVTEHLKGAVMSVLQKKFLQFVDF